LLNAKRVKGYKCFNFAFSGGRIGGFIEYARYIKQLGISPKLFIVGVDGSNFGKSDSFKNVPDFIRAGTKPVGLIKSYLSLDALMFSLRTILAISPLPRYYQRDFTAGILKNAPKYQPNMETSIDQHEEKYNFNNIHLYRELRSIFPNSKFIGYVPPISAWRIAAMEKNGNIDVYLEAIYRISRFIRPLYDFSIPSETTRRTDNTYDGSHYDIETNDKIIDCFNGETHSFGVRVDMISEEDYKNTFLSELYRFVRQEEVESPMFKAYPGQV
jgi:hypothetical protein